MKPEVNAVPPLCRSIKVLVVEDNEQMRDVLAGYLELHRLFDVLAVENEAQARAALNRSGGRHWHVCVNDLYLPDNADDRLGLVKSFRGTTAFLIVSGTGVLELAYEACVHGAMGAIRKEDLTGAGMRKEVFDAFLRNVIAPGYRPAAMEPVQKLVDALVSKRFENVTEWVNATRHEDSAHRKLWRRHIMITRRLALLVRKLYGRCFHNCGGPEQCPLLTDSHEAEEYLLNRAEIERIITHRV